MSLYANETANAQQAQITDATAAPEPGGIWPWVWMALACTLLIASGLVRGWQDGRFEAARNTAVAPTFPLRELPGRLTIVDPRTGTASLWRQAKGGDEALDPQVARIAGSKDSLVRNYVEEQTGVTLTLLVLYGQAERVSAHTAEVCYPAIGFEQADDLIDHRIRFGAEDNPPAEFRSTAFARRANTLERVEVYYSFRQQGRWSPHVEGNWKALSVDPALFKVQIQRRLADQERRHLNNPSEQFLAALLPELEKRIAAAAGTPPVRGSVGNLPKE
jgi:hypothetical protein